LIRKSRFVVATACVLALGVGAVAFADGTSENDVGVQGKVSPAKLDAKTFKPVQLFSGVTTTTTHSVPGQQNAEKVLLEFGKNVKFDLTAADTCDAPIAGTTTEQAKAACPPGSDIGTGIAHANLGGGPDQVNDVTDTVFNGPGPNHIRLHAASPALGPANTQVVDGDIIKAPSGGKFGQALDVEDAPDLGGDAFMLTLFNATITKASKTVLARCGKDKNFYWQNTTTYDDGTKDVSPLLTQKCTQKPTRGHH
jgi:hypothetical protein